MTTDHRYIRIDGELFLIVDDRDFRRPASTYHAEPMARALLANTSMGGRWDLERELGASSFHDQRRLVGELGYRLALGSLKVFREPRAPRLLDAVEIRPLSEADLPDAPTLRSETPARPDEPSVSEKTTWVEFRVVDQRGRPIEHLRARVELPEGDVREQSLEPGGRLSLIDVRQDGTCTLVLEAEDSGGTS